MLVWVQRNNASARETRFISTLFLLPSVFFEKKKRQNSTKVVFDTNLSIAVTGHTRRKRTKIRVNVTV